MNIETFSPALVLLFVGALLWILMDVHFHDFTGRKKWLAPLLILLLIPLALPLSMGTYILVPYTEAARASFYRSICRQAAGYTEEAGQEE